MCFCLCEYELFYFFKGFVRPLVLEKTKISSIFFNEPFKINEREMYSFSSEVHLPQGETASVVHHVRFKYISIFGSFIMELGLTHSLHFWEGGV